MSCAGFQQQRWTVLRMIPALSCGNPCTRLPMTANHALWARRLSLDCQLTISSLLNTPRGWVFKVWPCKLCITSTIASWIMLLQNALRYPAPKDQHFAGRCTSASSQPATSWHAIDTGTRSALWLFKALKNSPGTSARQLCAAGPAAARSTARCSTSTAQEKGSTTKRSSAMTKGAATKFGLCCQDNCVVLE